MKEQNSIKQLLTERFFAQTEDEKIRVIDTLQTQTFQEDCCTLEYPTISMLSVLTNTNYAITFAKGTVGVILGKDKRTVFVEGLPISNSNKTRAEVLTKIIADGMQVRFVPEQFYDHLQNEDSSIHTARYKSSYPQFFIENFNIHSSSYKKFRQAVRHFITDYENTDFSQNEIQLNDDLTLHFYVDGKGLLGEQVNQMLNLWDDWKRKMHPDRDDVYLKSARELVQNIYKAFRTKIPHLITTVTDHNRKIVAYSISERQHKRLVYSVEAKAETGHGDLNKFTMWAEYAKWQHIDSSINLMNLGAGEALDYDPITDKHIKVNRDKLIPYKNSPELQALPLNKYKLRLEPTTIYCVDWYNTGAYKYKKQAKGLF